MSQEVASTFDISNLLGKPCSVNIQHKAKNDGGQKAFIAGILPAMPDLVKHQPAESQMFFGINQATSQQHVRDTFPDKPDWFLEMFTKSLGVECTPRGGCGSQHPTG